ncbi:MAG: type II secretion system inner membrane protein GspF [Betaproteobacteria bacterium]|nr:type II secretion system inner membrane protein GspF [Betaproteobacteria bacterium]
MPAYKFTAYDLAGKEQKGVLEADSPRLARANLREQGLFPLDVALIESEKPGSVTAARIKLSTPDLARLTRQMSTLVGAGLTIEQTFNALVEQAESEPERQLLARVRGAVLEGQSLGAALGAYKDSFSDLYRTLVEAGEASGKLPEVLAKLADHVESREAIRQKLAVAMIYPAVVVCVCVMVIAALFLYVVPQVTGVFEATRQELPWLTRVLLAKARFLQATWWMWIVALVLGVIAFRAALQREAFKRRVDQWLLNLPILGRVVRAEQSSRLASTLSILAGSGVPVLQALQAGVGVVTSLPMRSAVERAAARVAEGTSLAAALGPSRQFPAVMVHLIASGEASGQLPATLARAAEQQNREVATRVGALAALVEPALILVMGGVVLTIVLAVLLPILQLNQIVVK